MNEYSPSPRSKRPLVLGSGGPDSVLAYLEAQYRHSLAPIYGFFKLPTWAQPAEQCAVDAMRRADLIPVRDYADLGELRGSYELESAHFPVRNLLLVLMAAAQGYREIIVALQKDETDLVDRSPEFLRSAAEIASHHVGEPVVVWSPFMTVDKTTMVQDAVRGERDAAKQKRARLMLEMSWSCYRPVRTAHAAPYTGAVGEHPYLHCGNCPACVRRFIAFSPNDVQTRYATHPATSPTGDVYWNRAKKGAYSGSRNARIIAALEPYHGNDANTAEEPASY